MRYPRPLPASLRHREFSRAEALALGVTSGRLRRRDIVRVGHGRYRWTGKPSDRLSDLEAAAGSSSEVPEPAAAAPAASLDGAVESTAAEARTPVPAPQPSVHATLPRASSVLEAVPDACASHLTAALVRGWWLPRKALDTRMVHITRGPGLSRLKRQSVITHRSLLLEDEVVLVNGRRTTSPERTWLDCATLLTVQDLAILGDHLVREPHAWAETRRTQWTTVDALLACLHAHPGIRGISRARSALALVRVGADSPQETLLRLAMARVDLPEPTLQIECWDPQYSADFPATADLGYPQWLIAIQYEGHHHGEGNQLAKDLRRDQAFLRQGWKVLRFGSADSAEDFRTAVELIERTIADARGR